jgi:raffinose/stachyose/melibiose transport system permease protein
MVKNSISNKVFGVIKYVFIYTLMLAFLFPFLMVVLNSVKSDGEFLSNPLSLPAKFSFMNFVTAFNKMDFIQSAYNSLVVTVIGTGLIVLFSSMTAYRFVRHASKFNKFMFFSMVATMIIPFQAVMIPLVGIYFGKLHIPGSKWLLVYMCIGFGLAQAVFMYSGFIKSIPLELEEASMIDGCTKLQTFFKIVFPLLVPITMTVVIIDVLWIWNDFLLPMLILSSSMKEYTLPLSTFKFFGTYTAQYTLLMASLLMTMSPILLLYLFLQKYIVAGLTQGAVKG